MSESRCWRLDVGNKLSEAGCRRLDVCSLAVGKAGCLKSICRKSWLFGVYL